MVEQGKLLSPRILFQLVFFVVLVPLSPLLLSRRWDWWEAWVFAVIWTGGLVASRALAARRHPDLLAERSRFLRHRDTKPWDRVMAPLVGFGSAMIPMAAGLEACSEPGHAFGLAWTIPAMLFLIGGHALGSWALVENRFFSGVVRIQSDRGHRVVQGGPYRWIRHPGYSGALVSFLAIPLFLESPWAFLPAGLLSVVLVVRTALEDRVLREELEGYRAYAGRVRYRLLPWIW